MEIPNMLDSASVRTGLIVSVLSSVIVFGGHQVLKTVTQEDQLTAQAKQIETLSAGQAETHDQVKDLAAIVARIEGKIDVVSQKIDDDRHPRYQAKK